MAYYKNQEDMFRQRAENNKKQGDYHYAQSKEVEARGDKEAAQSHMAQAQYQYKSQKQNEAKA
ncbi:hypothetical protein [Helicobacter suis]|uniref:Uncharacterized protein n=1 Tax=Helicobacter suis TaxID=104628 RepID=A0ABM7L0B1_9HELI|nr:hypothetical protein [Helicobacter suis]BCD46187.1 hypothetical protein NHP190020_12260 [Helicobacter suis]BCD49120.1 hypothetical protein NHP194004_05670 [Helicobacter suis]BCD51152.1 hypothetical protein NHP194022_08230 [Helicobacter suis]BDR27852.1 hypothetical protein HSHS1_06130 [Helicobacter suis HS1]GFK17368.1 hypothetical protein NHP190033_15440 [Helicobacter suis]